MQEERQGCSSSCYVSNMLSLVQSEQLQQRASGAVGSADRAAALQRWWAVGWAGRAAGK